MRIGGLDGLEAGHVLDCSFYITDTTNAILASIAFTDFSRNP